MRPAAAFAVGLWSGALLALGVGAFNWNAWKRAHSGPSPELTTSLQSKDEEIQRLGQQVSILTVEVQRLRRSVLETKSNLVAQAAIESPRALRRVPFRRVQGDEAPIADRWVVNAVLHGDSAALAELEQAATQNDAIALEGLALLADRDGGAALMRAWNAETLSSSNRVYATRLLAATVEVIPQGEEWLRGLFSTPDVNRQLLIAALAGLANPAFSSSLSRQYPQIAPPPRFAVDVTTRLRLFDSLREALPEEHLRVPLDRMRAELAAFGVPATQ